MLDFNPNELDKALEWYASIDCCKGGNLKIEDSESLNLIRFKALF